MITEQELNLLQISEEITEKREKIRRKHFPNIPQEVFVSLENFLFFIGYFSAFFFRWSQ